MREIGIVRLESLKVTNFKNIENGEIFFSEKKKVQRGEIDEDSFKNILGIYGQNGSGKTSCLNALRVIQTLISGNPLNPAFGAYIMVDKPSFGISCDFLIRINQKYYYSSYDIEIEKAQDKLLIVNEKLSVKDYETGNDIIYKFNNKTSINESFSNKLPVDLCGTYKYISKYESNNINNVFGLYSTIFNPKLYDLVVDKCKRSFGIYAEVVRALRVFGISRFSIYSINYFNENENVGIRFRFKKESVNDKNDKIQLNCGDIFVPFGVYQLPKAQYNVFEKTIQNINKVLPAIIPNFTVSIEISDENKLLNQYSGNVTFLLVGIRNGKKISLQYESNGIKKIISILSGLIEAYTNEGCLMAIDELDSGVFEYLLGEIVYAFDNFAEGQLLFTSHNMRILEKISYKNIFFTTTNSKNAFVQFTNVKNNNNLRDLYYRYLANGDEKGNQYFDYVKTEDLIASLKVPNGDCDD